MFEKMLKPVLKLSKSQMRMLIARVAEREAKTMTGMMKGIEKMPVEQGFERSMQSSAENKLGELARMRFKNNPNSFVTPSSPITGYKKTFGQLIPQIPPTTANNVVFQTGAHTGTAEGVLGRNVNTLIPKQTEVNRLGNHILIGDTTPARVVSRHIEPPDWRQAMKESQTIAEDIQSTQMGKVKVKTALPKAGKIRKSSNLSSGVRGGLLVKNNELTKRGEALSKGKFKHAPSARELMNTQPSQAEVYARLLEPTADDLPATIHDMPLHKAQRMLMQSGGKFTPSTEKINPVDILDLKQGTYTRRMFKKLNAPKLEEMERDVQQVVKTETRGRKASGVMSKSEKTKQKVLEGTQAKLESIDSETLRTQALVIDAMYQSYGGGRSMNGRLWSTYANEQVSKGKYASMTGEAYLRKVGLMTLNDRQRAVRQFSEKHVKKFEELWTEFTQEAQ